MYHLSRLKSSFNINVEILQRAFDQPGPLWFQGQVLDNNTWISTIFNKSNTGK